MIWMFLTILLVLAAFVLYCLNNAWKLQPTPAKDAMPPAVDVTRARRYAEKLSEMVRIPTVSSRFDQDMEPFYAFRECVKELFPLVHEKCQVSYPGDALVYYLPSRGTPVNDPILLMSHHDVVAAPRDGWEKDPFCGEIDEQGRVWGRGTVDTKGSLMCALQALEELLESGWEPEADVYITSSCTEEWSGPSAPAVVDFLKEKGVHLGMLMDEGGMILQEPIAGVKGRYCMGGVLEKGYGDVRVIARGKGGHASAPGKNTPLVRLGKLMCSIEKNSPFTAQITPTVKEMFTRLAPNMDLPLKTVFANLNIFGGLLKKAIPMISSAAAAMMQTTCAFTTCKGSDGLNVLPTEAYVTANLRFIHHQANEESLKLLKERAAKFDVDMEVIYQDSPCKVVDYTARPFRVLEQVADKVYPGYGVVPYVMTGGTDAKFYNEICDNCLRFAPLEINNQQWGSVHSYNETVDAAALVPAVDFYQEVLKTWCVTE